MNFIVVIPARYQSQRLPGKPLLPIAGEPMILHVARRAAQSGAKAVYVATDNAQIAEVCEQAGIATCMTDPRHQSGTDRIEEVARQLQLPEDSMVVNVQGDEPLIPPLVIDQVATNLHARPEAGICTLCEPIETVQDFHNPNLVKVVCDNQGYALYFSRAPIPHQRDGIEQVHAVPPLAKRHVGIYAYRVGVLHRFVAWPPSALEKLEKLEQLRAMANGVKIHVAPACQTIPPGVDTEQDLALVRAHLAKERG